MNANPPNALVKPPLRIVVTDAGGVTRDYLAIPCPVEPDPPPADVLPLFGYRVRRRAGGLSPASEFVADLDAAAARWVASGVFCFELVALTFVGDIGDVEATWTGTAWTPWTKAEVRS